MFALRAAALCLALLLPSHAFADWDFRTYDHGYYQAVGEGETAFLAVYCLRNAADQNYLEVELYPRSYEPMSARLRFIFNVDGREFITVGNLFDTGYIFTNPDEDLLIAMREGSRLAISNPEFQYRTIMPLRGSNSAINNVTTRCVNVEEQSG